jgi:hypothetical protein
VSARPSSVAPPSACRSPWFKRRPIRTPSDSTAEAEQREFVLRVCEVLLTSLILEFLASFRRRTGMRHPSRFPAKDEPNA